MQKLLFLYVCSALRLDSEPVGITVLQLQYDSTFQRCSNVLSESNGSPEAKIMTSQSAVCNCCRYRAICGTNKRDWLISSRILCGYISIVSTRIQGIY